MGVFALGDLRHVFEGHIVAVKDEDEVIEPVVGGEGDGFAGDPFLETAVTGERDDVVVDDGVLSGVVFGRGHFAAEGITDGIADALTERAGG